MKSMTVLRMLTIVAAAALAACSSEQGPPAGGYLEIPADQVVYELVNVVTVDGMRNARLQADSAYMYDDSSSINLFGVNLTIYDEAGGERATVTSATGQLDEQSRAMVARGNVILISGQERIETEELHYDPAQHRLWSDVRTRRTVNGSVAVGDAFTADDQFRNVNVVNARGSIGGSGIRF